MNRRGHFTLLCIENVCLLVNFCQNREENNLIEQIRVGNADQTPIYFDMPPDSTTKAVGDNTSHVCICGYEKQ